MFFATSLFNLPFLILIWLIEGYLFLSAVRLVLSRGNTTRQSHLYHQVKLLTDPLPNLIKRLYAKHTKVTAPTWMAWLVVIILACVVRQLLVSMVLT